MLTKACQGMLMIGALLAAGCAGDDNSGAADDDGSGGGGGSFTPHDVFDGCDASQSVTASCYLVAGTKPADYMQLPNDGCGAAPSHSTLACPAAHLVGVCETKSENGHFAYNYYYDTNQGNQSAQYSCEAAGQTWHKP